MGHQFTKMTLIGMPQPHAVPLRPALISDIRFTNVQINLASDAGIDTTAWNIDPDLIQDRPPVNSKGSHAFAANWPNPTTYPGSNLRVPYRIKTVDFSEAEVTTIRDSLFEMCGDLEGCVDFYDDTYTEAYDSKYILIRNTDEQGTHDPGCWSSLGFTNPSTYQSLNLGHGCVYQSTVQHEFMHALGFLHEQSRPDRDQHIDILWDNIIPDMHSQFWKMETSDWQDLEESYDLKSVMHYEGWSFLTEEAASVGNSSIVYKDTNDRFLSDPPAMSSSDIQQMLRRYGEVCQARTDLLYCNSDETDWTVGHQYYFPFQKCDGWANCNNEADEGFDVCQDLGCGTRMEVTGAGYNDGIYDMDTSGYTNGRTSYFRADPPTYLYSWSGNSNWHFGPELNGGSAYAWGTSAKCPTDAVWNSHGDNGWGVDEDFEVNCIEGCNDITTVPPTTITIPDGSIPCVPGFADAGYYYAEDECDGTAQCDNGQDENYGLCGEGGCGEVLEIEGSLLEINGYYSIRYSNGLMNRRVHYERVEPTNMSRTVPFMHLEKVDGKSGPIFRRHASVVQLTRLLNQQLFRAHPLLRRRQRPQRQLNRHGTRTYAPKTPTRSTTG